MKLIVLLAALSVPAQAQLWHADVAAPKPGLPSVSVDLGYPGPYTPSINSPIALRATGAAVPFNGYIGYHFEVKGRWTLDTPVVARALVQPRSSWSFDTILTMRIWGGMPEANTVNRGLVIEWRNHEMKVIATKSAGLPLWSPKMPLRVGPAPAEAFGDPAYVAAPAALSDRAQWYAGFANVIAPLDSWIDLPRPVRDAIFGSAIPVVLIGLPRANQRLDDVDRALLPVTFNPAPGSYQVPWPYQGSNVQTPMSWRAKEGADFIASASCPYLTSTKAATWAADDRVLTGPLPAMVRNDGSRGIYIIFDDPYIATHVEYRPAAVGGAMLLISAFSWLIVRKRTMIIVAAGLIASTLAVLAVERYRIRMPSGVRESVFRMPIAPGIVDEFRLLREHGPAPLPEHQPDRASLTGDFGFPEDAEVRRVDTAPSMGVLRHAIDYDATIRWTYRRRIGSFSAAAVRFVDPGISDFHGAVNFWLLRRPRKDGFTIDKIVHRRTNGPLSCAFALPSDTHGTVSVIANNLVGITSAAGTMKLTTTKRTVYSPPTAVIPEDVVREILASGGIFEINVAPNGSAIDRPVTWVAIRVQEKKS